MELSTGRNNVNFTSTQVPSIAELSKLILKTNYSLSTFKNDYRNIENFIQAQAMGLDFDDSVNLTEAREMFKDYKHIIAPTRNHQKEKNGKIQDRFRVIVFLSQRITDAESFYSTWYSLAKRWPQLDKVCKDPSRFYYPSTSILSMNVEGKFIDPTMVDKTVPKDASLSEPVTDVGIKGELSKRTLKFLLNGAADGQKHAELYAAARDVNQQGYSEDHFLAQLADLVERTGVDAYTDVGALATVKDAFNKAPKHEPRIKQKAFQFKTVTEMYQDKTEVDWVVDELLMVGGLSIISADPKAGKSTVARQLVREVLRGDSFFGRKCKKGKVFYLGMEEHTQVLNKSFHRLGIKEDDELLVHVGDILTDDGFSDFREILIAEKPALVVVDTMMDLIQVESENNYGEMKTKLRKLRQVARDSGTHILCVHHNNKSGTDDKRRGNQRILGSQAISGGMDAIMVIELDGKTRAITTSGREVKPWFRRPLDFDYDTCTYSLGKEEEY